MYSLFISFMHVWMCYTDVICVQQYQNLGCCEHVCLLYICPSLLPLPLPCGPHGPARMGGARIRALQQPGVGGHHVRSARAQPSSTTFLLILLPNYALQRLFWTGYRDGPVPLLALAI